MGVLCWDKPDKATSHEKWASIVADGAPPGVYIPNMSHADNLKWKAKLVTGALTRVEIRKLAGSQVKIVVSLKGQPHYRRKVYERPAGSGPLTRGKWVPKDAGHDDNVVITMNGATHLTFNEVAELHDAIMEAKTVLEKLNGAD